APGSPHTALRVDAFRGYADHLGSEEFARGYERLIGLARDRRVAVMCAETLWWRCHRRILADRLAADGWEVVHLLDAASYEPHRSWELARLEDGPLVYDAGAPALPHQLDQSAGSSSRPSR
ncbi:MAG: DUF488 family protein, partial [Solirubrobacteraceae bacterium]